MEEYTRKNKFSPKTIESYLLGKKKIEEYNLKRREEKVRLQDVYDSTPKICKNCGRTYYKAWTKSGKSEFCSSSCSRQYKREEVNRKVSNTLKNRKIGKAKILADITKRQIEEYITKPKNAWFVVIMFLWKEES